MNEQLGDPIQQRLGHDVVSRHRSTYFHTRDTYPNVGSLDHAHVVSAITNSKKYRILVLLHKLDNKRLLQWGDATCGTLIVGQWISEM
jgi:hypothetical protein